MTTFIDTSALYALLDADDDNHPMARGWFTGPGREGGETLLTHDYVIVESAALVHRRVGPAAVRSLLEDLLPVLSVVFVDEGLHRAALSAYLAAIRRGFSLVDAVSFQLMRNRGIGQVFAFDRDFETQGFRVLDRQNGRLRRSRARGSVFEGSIDGAIFDPDEQGLVDDSSAPNRGEPPRV